MFLSFTAFIYFLHTLIAYLPESIPTLFRTDQFTNETIQNESLPYTPFWSSMKPIPITRVYTLDLRPNSGIEQRLLRLADIGQVNIFELWIQMLFSSFVDIVVSLHIIIYSKTDKSGLYLSSP